MPNINEISPDVDPDTGEILPPAMGISASPEDRGEEATDAEVVEPAFDEAAFEAALRERMKAELAAARQAAPAPAAKSAAEVEAETVAAALAKVNAAAAAEAKEKAIADKVTEAQQRAASEQAAMDAAKANGAARAAPAAAAAPAKPAAGRQVSKPKPAAVPATADDLAALMWKDRGKGVDFEAKDITIPRLYLLQDMSPQVKERSPDFVPGARPGMWLNTVTMQATPSITLVPIKYQRRYVAWRPRLDNGGGGGLVRPDVPYEEYMSYEETGFSVRSYRDDKGLVEVVDTPEWIALLLPETDDVKPMPVAISFPKTKAKVAAAMNTIVTMQTIIGPDGTEDQPACYSNVFRLGQKVEGEGAQSYFVPTQDYLGRLTRLDIYLRAQKLFNQFDAGQVRVHDVGESEQE